MTDNYTYTDRLKALWENGVQKYKDDIRGADKLFTQDEQAFLKSIGTTAQEAYDFCEDAVNYDNQPDFTTFALVQDVRRNYFLHVQNGIFSVKTVDPDTLPAKTEEVNNIVWLPRIIEKAKIKLRGELDPDMMYGCGGDRKFFKTYDIHPAEFLQLVWLNEDNDQAVIDYISARAQQNKAA